MLPLDDVKEWLGVSGTDSDDLLEDLIDRVTEIIERDLDWYFRDPRDVKEILDGGGTYRLYLRQPPVDEAAVEVENRSGVGDAWETVDATYYEVDGRGLYADGIWARGKRNFRVSYAEGFSSVPGDVAQLFLDIMRHIWSSRDRTTEEGDVVSETIGDYSYTLKELESDLSMIPSYSQVKANWRRMRI